MDLAWSGMAPALGCTAEVEFAMKRYRLKSSLFQACPVSVLRRELVLSFAFASKTNFFASSSALVIRYRRYGSAMRWMPLTPVMPPSARGRKRADDEWALCRFCNIRLEPSVRSLLICNQFAINHSDLHDLTDCRNKTDQPYDLSPTSHSSAYLTVNDSVIAASRSSAAGGCFRRSSGSLGLCGDIWPA